MKRNDIHQNISQLFGGDYEYVVPLYQRNFAWREKEITQLLQDLYENFKTHTTYFVGSIVYIKRHGEKTLLEVIDGQQRLTVLTLILNVLGKELLPNLYSRRLSYDSRVEVAEYLNLIYSDMETIEDDVADYSEVIKTFNEAHNTIKYCDLEVDDNPDKEEKNNLSISSLQKDDPEKLKQFADYIANSVYFVLAEMPQDTDVATYFEIMNNTGEQLKKHEIVKSQILAIAQEKGFPHNHMKSLAMVWDACSQMDVPIQSSIPAAKRSQLFGANYDEFHPSAILELVDSTTETDEEAVGIDAIIADNKYAKNDKKDSKNQDMDDDDNNENRGSAIIDFPNFLMHVLRLYHEKNGDRESDNSDENNSIPLNEKELLNKFKEHKDNFNPEDFIAKLLYYRIILDRYLVRSEKDTNDTSNEDGRWTLRKPKKDSDSTTVRRIDTFSDNPKGQEMAIKALSMLQVSYPQRKYKRYLNKILSWFEYGDVKCNINWYMTKLNKLINEFMTEIEKNYPKEEELYSLGTKTPRFVLNLVDYLYYLNGKGSDFDFRYYNSVEHHLAQSSKNYRKEDAKYIDMIGNLFLLSRRANSSLNAGDPLTKAGKAYAAYPNLKSLPPNRRYIYQQTRNKNGWDGNDIQQHTEDIKTLLEERRSTLELKEGILEPAHTDTTKSFKEEEEYLQKKDEVYYRACLCVQNYCEEIGRSGYGSRRNFHNLSTSKGKVAESVVNEWLKAHNNLSEFISERLTSNKELKADTWRWLFVSHPAAMEYCKEGNFILEVQDGIVYLLPNQIWSQNARELRIFLLAQKLKEVGLSIEEFPFEVIINLDNTEFAKNFSYQRSQVHVWIEDGEEGSAWCWGIYSTRRKSANENHALLDAGWTRSEDGFYAKEDGVLCEFSLDYTEVLNSIRRVLAELDELKK